MSDKTFFDDEKDPELQRRIDELQSYVEAKLTEEQNDMVTNIMIYIKALTDPEDYAERYVNTNYTKDDEVPSVDECMSMQKARCADYFCE